MSSLTYQTWPDEGACLLFQTAGPPDTCREDCHPLLPPSVILLPAGSGVILLIILLVLVVIVSRTLASLELFKHKSTSSAAGQLTFPEGFLQSPLDGAIVSL